MTDHTDHHGPEGLRTRGTIIVVPGRGETLATYTRLGRRLAADAYRVRVTEAPVIDTGDIDGSLRRFGSELAEAVEGTTADDGVVHPVVLVGADTGSVAIAALLGRVGIPVPWRPDAVVLAGLPGRAATADGPWGHELDVRTFCPAHRATLADDPQVHRGALGEAVPDAVLTAAYQSDIPVPALVLTGDADPLADREALIRVTKSSARARLSVVRGAHHDVLNDLQHRSVAAEIVTFLEALRTDLVPAIAVETSDW